MKRTEGNIERCYSRNLRTARRLWPDQIRTVQRRALRSLTERYGFDITAGDLTFLNGGWYVTYAGLLTLAARNGCCGIETSLVSDFCVPSSSRWVFRAVVHTRNRRKPFIGYGDADPSNVSPQVRGAEMRVAETRAVNRALRKAYGIGICSVEEIGSFPAPPERSAKQLPVKSKSTNGNGDHPLRDRLCLLIRKHGLDANLVKLYAADFCGTQELRQASREQVAEFITHLAQYAEHDRDGLLCRLNSYAPKPPAPAVPQGNQDQEKVAGAA